MTDSAAGVELLDIVDDMGRHLGVKPRHEVHLDGDWHRVFHCQIVAERADGPVAVLQRRSMANKVKHCPINVSPGFRLIRMARSASRRLRSRSSFEARICRSI